MDLFDVPISAFRNDTNTRPHPFNLRVWIDVTRTVNPWTEHVIRYRETGDDQIKDRLPRATISAVCEGGRTGKHVKHRTGWIAIDADAKDNDLTGPNLRALIADVEYVAYAALSASGLGVWALIRIVQPERQAEHFEQILADFETIGVNLDPQKGKNPNDCRSISYDPDGVFNRDAKTYTRRSFPKPLPKPRRLIVKGSNGLDRYAEAALRGELDELARTGEGNRNHRLFVAAASLGGLVGAGVLDEHVVADQLRDVAQGLGLGKREIEGTIKSGLRRGKNNPRSIAR